MQTCKKIPNLYTTNYGRMIEMLIEGINYLSGKFLHATTYIEKETIKGNIAVLRHYLTQHTKSEQYIDGQEYAEFQAFLDTMLEV